MAVSSLLTSALLFAALALQAQAQNGFLAGAPPSAGTAGSGARNVVPAGSALPGASGSDTAGVVDGAPNEVATADVPGSVVSDFGVDSSLPGAGASTAGGAGGAFRDTGAGAPPLSVIDNKSIVILLLLVVLFCVVCILPCCCMREAYECLCGPGSWGGPQGCGYTGTEMAAAGLAGMAGGYYMGEAAGYPGGYGGGYQGGGYGGPW